MGTENRISATESSVILASLHDIYDAFTYSMASQINKALKDQVRLTMGVYGGDELSTLMTNEEIALETEHLVEDERAAQDDRWGEQNHDPAMWLTILQEEIGECAQEVLRMNFDRDKKGEVKMTHRLNYRRELIQVTAVAMAMLESELRAKWKFPSEG